MTDFKSELFESFEVPYNQGPIANKMRVSIVAQDLLNAGLFPFFNVYLSFEAKEGGTNPRLNLPYTQIHSPDAIEGMDASIPANWNSMILLKLKITSSISKIELLPDASISLQVNTVHAGQNEDGFKSENVLKIK